MPTVNLEELLARAQSRSRPGTCRVGAIVGDAGTYIERLDAIETATPRIVNRAQVHRDLQAVFGETLHVTAVQDHFNRECACGR